MDISYLSEFVVLSEELNYSRAAERLHISQPALSNHVQALEEELGVKLFDRTRRHVALTQEGRLLMGEAQQITKLFQDMHRFDSKNLTDNDVITAGGFLENPEVLGQLVMRIRSFAAETGIQARLLCDYSPFHELVEKLADKKLDFLVTYPNDIEKNTDDEAFGSVPFYCDPFFVALNKSNPLANKDQLRLEDLNDYFACC